MASVGGVNCDRVMGSAADLKQRVETVYLPGLNGLEAQALGLGDAPFFFVADLRGTAAVVDAWLTALMALQGTIVTIVDDWGTSWTNLLIKEISQPTKTPWVVPGTTTVCKGSVQILGEKVA